MKQKPPVGKVHVNLKRYIGRVDRAFKRSLVLVRFWEHLRWRTMGQEFVGGEIDFRRKGVTHRGRFWDYGPVYIWTWQEGGKEFLHVQAIPKKDCV